MSTVFKGNDVAFAFVDSVNGLVITYRDMFGKRSLLLASNGSEIAITSVALSEEQAWFEQPSNSVIAFPLESVETPDLIYKRWTETPSMLRFGQEIKPDKYIFDTQLLKVHRRNTIKLLLLQAVKARVINLPSIAHEESKEAPSVGLMFSGGLDSTLLAACLAEAHPGLRIDLVNVSFSPETAADRITGLFSYHELRR